MTERNGSPLVSVVLPCLNEENGVGICVQKILRIFEQNGIDGEVVVCDNGSTDRSAEIARAAGAKVVSEPERGYGRAYLKGFASASGEYLIMADADDTYDFSKIPVFLRHLAEKKVDFVTGSRYLAEGDAHITPLHRFFGNPLLTMILNFMFGTSYTDVYCGYRAFTREAYRKIRPLSPGMEFNLELAINAHRAALKIAEVPIRLRPRKGKSKLSTWRDGWRSLRMMLLYSPNKVFLWPGSFLFAVGACLYAAVLTKWLRYEGRPLGAVTGIFAAIFTVLGFEILVLGLYAKTYSWSRRFEKQNRFLAHFYRVFNLEKGLLAGVALTVAGVAILAAQIRQWFQGDLLPLPNPEWASFGSTLVILGSETVFCSLFISAMSMRKQ